MIGVNGMDYAQARLSARHGARPGEAAWRAIEAIRGLPALLDAARGSALRDWVSGMPADPDVHAIEARLRARWRALVAEVAGWMPEAWRPAVEWAGTLPDMPVLQHLARGGPPAAWMREDPVYGALVERGAPAGAHLLTPLAGTWSRPDRLWRAWRVEWARRLPRGIGAELDRLRELRRLLALHRAECARGAPGEGALLRRALHARLVPLFRRATLDPAAAFVFLALAALDLERLRGELVRRALLPGRALAS